ncbi:putative START domain-containing protein [Helianthus annuus]|nr:putative START domain-containing protein [Helianthus annuus]
MIPQTKPNIPSVNNYQIKLNKTAIALHAPSHLHRLPRHISPIQFNISVTFPLSAPILGSTPKISHICSSITNQIIIIITILIMDYENYFHNIITFITKPAVMETFVDIFFCAVPIWAAVMVGVLIGWAWTPRWTSLLFLGFRSKLRGFAMTVPPGFGARRLWLAFTALSAFSVGRRMWSNFREKERKDEVATPRAVAGGEAVLDGYGDGCDVDVNNVSSGGTHDVVTEKDLEYLLHLLDGKDAVWQSMIERSTSNMACQAWRYEPESGPVVYRSRTVFEDATPELVRDFFWDDEFRPKWDPMLTYVKILEECPRTGTMIVNWVKKFPFFCSDREYVIGRRIWEAGTGKDLLLLQYPGVRRRDKPRRVDRYFSSWVIRPVQSRKGDGVLSSCEVILLHSEDMGIPRDVAKLGVRHGMWGTVKKLHGGFRAYQSARKQDMTLSRCALMATITTKISFDESVSGDQKKEDVTIAARGGNVGGGVDWRWVAIGGAVAVVFGVRTGTLGKVLLAGAGQRFGRRR